MTRAKKMVAAMAVMTETVQNKILYVLKDIAPAILTVFKLKEKEGIKMSNAKMTSKKNNLQYGHDKTHNHQDSRHL